MVDQRAGHGRVVDIHGFAFLHVVAAGDAVVGIEETGVDAGDDVLALRTPPGADFGQGLAEILAVVAVVVGVGIGHLFVGIGGGQFDLGIAQVDLQHVHVAGHADEGTMDVFYAGVQLFLFQDIPVVIGILRPVHGVFLQLVGAGGVNGRGVDGSPPIDGSVAEIAGELVGGGIEGTTPGGAEVG